ncbi:tRNA (cytidine(34)-2'-O)-methyltransferase [Salidesulfovibrio onnuriiensis]|uniref:tRNA (cytidine(34)-2'-O)-methyltransferase n=1 Tax=Salidesulfovibrio onnuriiensis TaxID=2583823 RepID=UPI0011CB9801|nr:tRNA (cytidine(34)-2'-O)-methyltransferase [Salidesulfovibrio onnuriiensis]
MRIVLFQPEIPPNTGNIARLCAATKTPLHLIEPLGFTIDDKHLKRAGLDYWPHVSVTVHPDWDDFLTINPERIVLTSARQGTRYCDFRFRENDCIVLGPETTGLPKDMLTRYEHKVTLPIWGQVRSLNLSTATGILLYEALRQTDGFGC